jgi:hypothetical protein
METGTIGIEIVDSKPGEEGKGETRGEEVKGQEKGKKETKLSADYADYTEFQDSEVRSQMKQYGNFSCRRSFLNRCNLRNLWI